MGNSLNTDFVLLKLLYNGENTVLDYIGKDEETKVDIGQVPDARGKCGMLEDAVDILYMLRYPLQSILTIAESPKELVNFHRLYQGMKYLEEVASNAFAARSGQRWPQLGADGKLPSKLLVPVEDHWNLFVKSEDIAYRAALGIAGLKFLETNPS